MLPFSKRRTSRAAAAVLLLGAATACRTTGDPGVDPAPRAPSVVQPGPPGEISRVLSSGETIDASLPHTEADVRFMQGMIHHHAQALAMAALALGRAGSEDIRRLAHRIDITQLDEIQLMRNWLQARGEEAPEPDPEHTAHMEGHEHEFMPGMLTHEQMQRLEAAAGSEFDQLFLAFMIQHHEGALVMVDELFRSDGAAFDLEISDFASHVAADQSIEIRRMQAMLSALP